MSRRPLPKIFSSLDVSARLFAPEQLPKPWAAAALFGRDAPLEVEIGSGKGLFITQAAAANPKFNFLGIELAVRYAQLCAAKIIKSKLTNAWMIQGKAEQIFAEYLPEVSVRAVHVYFPDPWWKKRHRKRRVMSEQFVKAIERVLEPGGVLHFWTDVEEYFRTTVELLAKSTSLEGPFEVAAKPAEHDLDFRTHFERRMRLHNEAVYRCEFRKPIAAHLC